LAFYKLVRALGKEGWIVNEEEVPPGYDFLPGVNSIMRFKDAPRGMRFSSFVILDCSDLRRCGKVAQLAQGKPIINIDHHISNPSFAQINWVDADYSSCAQMVYKLYKELRVPFNRDIALLLYIGMLTDTGSFRYSNTSRSTHQAVAELLKFKLDTVAIYKKVYEDISFADVKLIGKILPAIRQEAKGRIAWFQIERRILKRYTGKSSFDLAEYLFNFARAIKGVEVAVIFKHNLGVENEIRVNFRSQGKVDVNKIAAAFGGGGHKTASSCTIKGDISRIKRTVLRRIKEELLLISSK